jgi:hypothetical protein
LHFVIRSLLGNLFVDVKTALFAIALQPPPATRTNVLTLFDLARARLATNAGVAFQVQRVDGYILLFDVGPNITFIPIKQGVELGNATGII